ncbi:CYTH and CHAD domain-containing protein [Mycobacterium koreense]|uniref:Uncharacterized protein n=1 Tax=Mycolicibacillus koreensis TaxID=1069220 RepID=A0A7I7SAC2_9MYCO|nr:CYTH and CHAD domain-containing protein [Mycolicibacillus koreensis]MCV7249327.1 CYTH and CHAD domain-containing protein [Mycolicibacillus koreensis]OSC35529.1 hypothetical protein B8W67_02040 [Mycolicibacillus koreensis]BBY53239.1 hypothetical protein MKOR_04900 [Mycolicibacillus koreensis]
MAAGAAHAEVERKFDVDESTPPPNLARLVAAVHRGDPESLDAEYFDTEGHDLAARRITLRRRLGGTDAGWHLTLPAGTHTRFWAPPHSETTAPPVLVDRVRAVVRDRPLGPIARIATTRVTSTLHDDTGAVRAQFHDDRVAAWTCDSEMATLRWREWEIELTDPDDRALLTRLTTAVRHAGAHPAGQPSKLARLVGEPAPHRPGDALRRALADQVEALLRWDRAVRDDADDAIHQMRVTTRRIRSLLRDGGLGADTVVLDELRELAALLGSARDAEVLAQRYRAALDALDPQLVRGPVRARLVGGAERAYHRGWRRVVGALDTARYFRLLDGLDALVADSCAPSTSASGSVSAAYKRLRRAAKNTAGTAGSGRDEALHRIRKAAKRLRYLAAASDTRGGAKVARRAAAIQTLLGEHQDSVVARTHLRQQADAAHAAGEDTFTYGLLHEREELLARDRRSHLDAALDKLARAMRRW